jgi:hypothetical protein
MKILKILTNNLNLKKMEHSCEINEENRTITVVVVGEVHANDFAKLDVEVCSLALKLNYKLIFNFSNAIVRIGLGEAYFWFSDHLDKVNISFRRIPIAHIANNLNEPFFRFVEVAWTNRGIRTKMFKEVKSALEWLDQFDKVRV